MMSRHRSLLAGAAACALLFAVACAKCTCAPAVEPGPAVPATTAPSAFEDAAVSAPSPDEAGFDAACDAPSQAPAPPSTFTPVRTPARDAGSASCVEREVVRAYVILQRPCSG